MDRQCAELATHPPTMGGYKGRVMLYPRFLDSGMETEYSENCVMKVLSELRIPFSLLCTGVVTPKIVSFLQGVLNSVPRLFPYEKRSSMWIYARLMPRLQTEITSAYTLSSSTVLSYGLLNSN